jgi:hypothetical protein
MMVISNEPKLVICEANIIYKPKPKKVYKSNLNLSPISHLVTNIKEKKKQKHKNKNKLDYMNLNLKKNGITKSQNFDLISFEEIENDFKNLKAQSERVKVENELLKLLENSTKDSSSNEDERKNKKIKRPKNILYKNCE